MLLAPNPSAMTLDGTRTFIVGVDRPVVIDPGPDDAGHLEAILSALGEVRPRAIFVTHGHGDHSEAAVPLARRTGSLVWFGRDSLQGGDGELHPVRRAAEGDRIETDAGDLSVVETPGHAPEHLSLLWKREKDAPADTLFAGDLFMGAGDTTLVAPPEGSLADYLRTLERIASFRLSTILPAHGPPIRDAPAAIERYRSHREQRIEQVRVALAANPSASVSHLVDLVYGTQLDPSLRGAAQGSLESILAFLRRDDVPIN
jgi:glyoxylase-like metal-dependent hydrolase (beta-lactamase superfamily II)